MIRTSILAATAAGFLLSGCSQDSVLRQPLPNEAALTKIAATTSNAESGPSLYVANNGATDVTVYGLDGSGPNQILKNGLRLQLRSVALDSSSNLYVAMRARRGSAGEVNEYAHGKSEILRKIKVVQPIALAVDRANNLYVLGLKGVEVFPPGSSTPSENITDGIKNPTAMVLDKSGNIYVGNGGNENSITVYSATGKFEPKHYGRSSGTFVSSN